MSDVSRTETRPEYEPLALSIVAHLIDRGLHGRVRTVIGVAGESGSGKSVTAAGLARALGDAGQPAIVLHQDDYFILPPRANHAARELDIGRVGRGEVNLALLQSHVAAFRAGRDGVDGPLLDYAGDRFETRRIAFSGIGVLVVEGTYVLGLDDLDTRIFLEATYADTSDRRRARARDVDSPFVERVLAIEHEIIARQVASADLLLDAHFAVRAAANRNA
jgi:uridine kinase